MDAVVALGSNLGSREALLRLAEWALDAAPRVSVGARSRLYRTDPVGPPQPDYLNAALALTTDASPRALLETLLAVEARLGRVRGERWGPRTLDLDLLVCGRRVDEPDLTVPHPRLRERAFALAPLLDVAPALAGDYGADLERAGGAPPSRAWTAPSRHEAGALVLEALDDADALALAVSAWFGAPRAGAALEPVRAADPTGFARAAAGPCAILAWEAGVIRGVAARSAGPPRALAAVEVGGGRCVIRGPSEPGSDAPPKLL
jgi:2-amino-4-hydroxy-6-hydroxymethyldihydropteridine diphosphokinase